MNRAGLTTVELSLFGAIGFIVLVGIVGTLTRSTKLAEITRRTSAAQTDLRLMLEALDADVAELAYFEQSAPFDSAAGAAETAFRFVVRSTRTESGLSLPGSPTLRRVEYRVRPAEGTFTGRDLDRTVTPLGSGSGTPAVRTVARGLSRLRSWPIAAVPVPGSRRYNLAAAADARARGPQAIPACLVVACAVGQSLGATEIESGAATQLVTKIWCRNRLADISRGALR